MSKIIREGELPVARMTCKVCGCEFEYDRRDVERGIDLGALSLSDWEYHYVDCPYCGESHKLPANILERLSSQKSRKEFEEDAKALAKQYGLEIIDIKVK